MPHQAYSKDHPFIFNHLHLSGSASVYLTHTIRAFAISLIGIYLPVLIFTLPNKFTIYADSFANSATWTLIYFALRSGSAFISTLLFSNYIFSKLHLKRSIFISSLILTCEFILWLLIDRHIGGNPLWSWGIVVAGIISGLKTISYWIPHHIFFVSKTQHARKNVHYGKQAGNKMLLVQLASAAGPVIGGILISRFGFDLVLSIGIILLLFSVIPITFGVIDKTKHKISTKMILKNYVLNKQHWKTTIAFLGRGIDDGVYTVFWPILLFQVLQNFVKLGSLTTVSLLFSLTTAWWVSRYIDKNGHKLVHVVGTAVNSILYIPRILFSSASVFYAVDILDRLNSGLFVIPFLSSTYEKAKEDDVANFVIYREIAIHFSIALMAITAILLLPILGEWKLIFIFAAIGSLMSYMINLG